MLPVYKLHVYVLAEELSDTIWALYDSWPNKVKRTIGYQILRSADSISANIAEGYGRLNVRKLILEIGKLSIDNVTSL